MARLLLTALLALLALPAAAGAATFTVTTELPTGAGSLRTAIDQANAAPGADDIVVGPGVDAVDLPEGLPAVTAPLTLDGTTADGGRLRVRYTGSLVEVQTAIRLLAGATGSTVRDLDLAGWNGRAVFVDSGASGVAITGTRMTGGRHGVEVSGGGVTIDGNEITGNTERGVWLRPSSVGARVEANRIDGNGGLGIDVGDDGGVTPNDPGDADPGQQNFPVLTGATVAGDQLRITGTIDTTASAPLLLRFARSGACDPSGHGEAAEPLGALALAGEADGTTAFEAVLPAPPPGEHVLTATARNTAAGSTSELSACRAVSVPAPQQPPVAPPPVGPPLTGQSRGTVPPPVQGVSFNAEPVRGTVTVTPPGGRRVPLRTLTTLPARSVVDARRGVVRIVSARGTATQSAVFSGGVFRVEYRGSLTVLRLVEDVGLASCPGARRGARTAAASAPALKAGRRGRRPHRGRRPRRGLWGDGHGRFQTVGQHSATTVRGTRWLVQDTCAGTLTRVARGVVSVRDFGRRRTVTVRAGRRYLARPAARRRR